MSEWLRAIIGIRNYEQLTAVAETLITIAASATLLRRWA